jgi:hypothetical protein
MLLAPGLVACFLACAPSGSGAALFEDVTAELGLPYPEEPPADGAYYLPEMMQGGLGLFDYDGDGDLDLLHVRAPLPGGDGTSISNRLYRQEEDGRFVDVTREAGLERRGFGQGLAIGDVDNDGDPDVYITNYGPDDFYLNDGDGSFTRATERAGFSGNRWSTAAAFIDYDGDGFQDLFLVHYVKFDPTRRCADPRDRREYCGPWTYRGRPDKLYRNRGDGTFEDVTAAAGIVLPEQGTRSTGLGTVCTDLTGDGLPDFFVANDLQSNQLWVNRGDGTFSEEGLLRGVATNEYGHPEASMGVTAGDVNGDGELDVFMTHLWQENNRLFLGGAQFADASVESKLALHDLERTGWGCGFFDFDHDGDLDLAVANGGVRRRPPIDGGPSGMWAEYAEPNQLFENDGAGGFVLADELAGSFASDVEVSRGLALGDLDEDGDLDLIVSGIDNTLHVFRNNAPAEGTHWAMVRALTRGRDALGAQVRIRAGALELCTPVLPASSYLSSCDPRAHFGLGANETIDSIEVLWPDGSREEFGSAEVDRVITVRQGEGRKL